MILSRSLLYTRVKQNIYLILKSRVEITNQIDNIYKRKSYF